MNDHILIATAYHGEARIYVSYTKDLVEQARSIHQTWPTATAALGRLLTAAAMMSFFNKDDSQLTLRIDGDGPLESVVAEANYLGEVRGLVKNSEVYLKDNKTNKLAVGKAIGNGFLTVIRNPGLKTAFTSSIELISGEVAEDLTYYFTTSEQTPSSVGLGVLIAPNNTVDEAGGFIIQLLPNASENTIIAIENALKEISAVTSYFKAGLTTLDLLAQLASNTQKILFKHDLIYRCGCDKQYYKKTLAKLDAETLNTLIKEDQGAEVVCHYCKTKYYFTATELQTILDHKKTTSR